MRRGARRPRGVKKPGVKAGTRGGPRPSLSATWGDDETFLFCWSPSPIFGQCVVDAWSYAGKGQAGRPGIYTVQTDSTGVEDLGCDVRSVISPELGG